MQRIIFRHTAPAQWQKLVEAFNKALGGEVSNVKIGDPAATRVPFTISYQVSKGNFLDWSKKKLQVRLPFGSWNPASIAADVGEEDEDSPAASAENFKIGPPNEQIYRLKLDLVSRFHADAPVPMALERDYGLYQSTYKVEGTTFSAERKLVIRQGELPPARANDYRSFRQGVLADGNQSLAIESTSADTRSAPAEMKTADLIRSGNEARTNGNYGLAIELLNRAVEADPKNKLAWNSLGLAYLDDRQDQLAINAFQKQIEVNTFDQNAYNNLGRVYLRQRKYGDADKWFNKQIEVNPLDKYAHANLGVSYLEQQKYEDSVPELQKAVSITPATRNVKSILVEAYLNLGQDEKAMASFEKALTIAATPLIWNNIAYQLACKGAHLDRARSYAESAVSATSAALRNVSLDQVNKRDPGLSASLANYWDTLGWVAFAEGNFDVAGRYVFAAWQLGEHSEVADHLGQIYTKQGKTEEAAHFFAFAMSARRPKPETRNRLASLLGGNEKVDAWVEKYRNQLLQERTIKLANTAKLDGRADFFVLLSPGQGTATTVEAISFVNGDDKLKSAVPLLKTANFTQTLPDQTPVKIIRRGTLSCKNDDCSFLVAVPDDVKSID